MRVEARKLGALAWGVTTVFLCLILFPPWRPAMPSAGLDPAWFMVVSHAFTQGWQFGRDVIFTYGPLGFLAPPSFFPGLYPVSVAYWLIFYAVFGATLIALYARAGAWKLVPLLVLLIAGLSLLQDARVFGACALLFLIGRRNDPVATGLSGALTVLQAIAALMKMTYAAASLPVVVLTDIVRFVQYRKLPILTPIFVVSYLAAYLAAGQELTGLFTYLAAAREISAGYSEAMVENAPIGEVVAFVAIASAGVALIIWHELRQGTLIGAAVTLGVLAIIIFLAAKAGFVRHDIGHAIIPWLTLPLVFVAFLSNLRGLRAAVMTVAIVLSLGFFGSAHGALKGTPAGVASLPSLLMADVNTVIRADVSAVNMFLFHGQYAQLLLEWPEFLKLIAKQNPLPATEGTVDISGGDQAILYAHGYEYRPRPVFQSYSAYTPALAATNAAFLRSDRAPDTILFKVASIDGRLPALDDGALYLDFLRLYDAVGFEHGYAVLKRRAMARDVDLADTQTADLALGAAFDASAHNSGVVWAEIDLRPSLLGRLRNILFKPPVVEISLTLSDGRIVNHRLVPGMAQTGFILSPYIAQTEQLRTLRDAQPHVTSFTVGPAKLAKYFQQPSAIRLSSVRIAE